MRVFLKGRSWGVFRAPETVEGFQFRFIEEECGGDGVLSVTSLHELKGQNGRLGGDGNKLEQAVGRFDLAVLDLQPLFFEDPEELFDGPSAPIPVDDLPGGCGGLGTVGG